MIYRGELTVTVQNAQFRRDHDLLGKMDPYVLLRIGAQESKTQIAKSMGKTPVWNAAFAFSIKDEQMMEIYAYDDDIGKDKLIGRATLPLAAFLQPRTMSQAVPVTDEKGGDAGTIFLQLSFKPNATAGGYPAHQGYVPQPGYVAPSPIGGYTPVGFGGAAQSFATHSQVGSYVPAPAMGSYVPAATYAPTTPVGGYVPTTSYVPTTPVGSYVSASHVGGFPSAVGPSYVATTPVAAYTQPAPAGFPAMAPAGGYTQTTPVPGGYTTTTTYPNGYTQTTFTQSSSYVPPTSSTTYGPGGATTTTTYSSSESSYQSNQNSYARIR